MKTHRFTPIALIFPQGFIHIHRTCKRSTPYGPNPFWNTLGHGRTEMCTENIPSTSNQATRPPTLCLCLEFEWLVFHFGQPGALVRSLAWPVYHYWSLSLTWTNRGLFSKVVSQVAVTDMSGTIWPEWSKHRERKNREEKPSMNTSQTGSYTEERLFYCSRGGQRPGVLGKTILLHPLSPLVL